MKLISINPSTGEEISLYKEHSSREVMEMLDLASRSQQDWKNNRLSLKIEYLPTLSSLLKDRTKELAICMAEEMGKPISQGISEITKCASLCDYYYSNSVEFLKPQYIDTEATESYFLYEPLGVILGIMPWNFPFWQVFRFAIPTLIAGNSIIIKHASNVQGCANQLEKLFKDAGFQKGLYQNLSLSSINMKDIIEHSTIQGVSFTGSTLAGKAVGELAGRTLKKVVMELGGNDPYVILKDADLDLAVDSCIDGRILNAGQSCIAAKRIIVDKEIVSSFIKKMVLKINTKIMGDPMDDVDLGPMVNIYARTVLHQQVIESVNKGARLIDGGYIPDSEGAFYPLTLLTDIKPGMPAFDEELFGPVISIVEANDESHAIELANQTSFGLGGAVFTQNIKRGKEIAEKEIQTGACFVNDFVKSDPRLPFGGIKESGVGREMAQIGMTEFVNIKTVVIK